MERHYKSQLGEANTESKNTYTIVREQWVQTQINKQKPEEPVIPNDWLRLPSWKKWEIKLEICMIPTMTR